MTDDQTRQMDIPESGASVTPPEPATPGAPVTSAAPATSATAAGSTAPVTAVGGGSNRTRWLVSLGVAGVALAGTIAAILLLSSPTTAEALRYIPDDAAAVVELRLDLPGDQMQHLGNLLAHFPGFADQSTLNDKLDEALTRFVAMSGEADLDYRTDIKPWVNGPLFVAVYMPPDAAATDGSEQALISATTNGAVSCAAAFEGEATTQETYQGLSLVLSSDSDTACAVVARQGLIGDPALVRRALDAKAAGTGMDKSQRYAAARASVPGDRLVTMYFNGTALQSFTGTSEGLGIPGMPSLAGAVPEWLMLGARAEDDAFVIDTTAAPFPTSTAGPTLLPNPPAHASLLAPMVPADTLAFLEYQGAGVGLQNLITQLSTIPDLATPLQMLDGLGGSRALVGWIDDIGVAVSVSGANPNVAVMLVATDETTASSTVSSLTTLLGFAGLGEGIEVTESTVAGVAVTRITITDLNAVVPPGTVPGLEELPVSGPISFSIAARGRVVLVTVGDEAMTGILNTGAGSGLVDQAAFKQAAARGLANSRATVFLNVGASLDLVKPFLAPEELAAFEADVAPYVDPLQSILITTSDDGATNRSRIVLSVGTP